MSPSKADLIEAAKIVQLKEKRIATGGGTSILLGDHGMGHDDWMKMRSKEVEAEELLKNEALKVYAPLRKLAQAGLYLALVAIISLLLYLVAAVIYLTYVYSPITLLLVGGVVGVVALAIFVATGDVEEPPDWLTSILRVRLTLQMKWLEKRRVKLLHKLEEAEAQKIENQLL
jgi:hypothetical protein